MSVAELPIHFDQAQIDDFCQRHGIRRLALFGSVLRPDFDEAMSDVDVLADFRPGATRNLGLDYFSLQDELTEIFGRPVDFCSKLNRHLRPLIEEDLLVMYEQA